MSLSVTLDPVSPRFLSLHHKNKPEQNFRDCLMWLLPMTSATCAILENIDLEVLSDLDLNVSSSLTDCGILNKSLTLSEILSSVQ